MMDFTLILFWVIALAVLYFLGPISIYFIGLLALLCCLCCSSLSTVSSSSVKVLKTDDLVAMNPNLGSGNVKIVSYDPSGRNQVLDPNIANIKVVRIQPANGYAQCGGDLKGAYLGTSDGFDMTADQVYAAFREHPYNGEDLGYGYYDGYDYVL